MTTSLALTTIGVLSFVLIVGTGPWTVTRVFVGAAVLVGLEVVGMVGW